MKGFQGIGVGPVGVILSKKKYETVMRLLSPTALHPLHPTRLWISNSNVLIIGRPRLSPCKPLRKIKCFKIEFNTNIGKQALTDLATPAFENYKVYSRR